MTQTNIKNLPEGNYFTEIGWSQEYPWVEIARTAKTVTLAKVEVKEDPVWKDKLHFVPGGFVGTVTNQSEQTWLFDKIDHSHTTKVFLTKRGWARKGVKFSEGRAIEFYDYNF